jgi:diaminohydroxyphosphoribosylaminopyrimidine deaminase/5-amino-6-(5-phosphoribosylamino)uracil reductase
MVGAVLVRDGAVVGEGWHAQFGGPHAEVVALERAGDRARGATAYVTLEPCAHTGKTPPCANALADAGVSRVVYAADDPNPAAGGGADVLRAAGVHVERGLAAAESQELNPAFFHRFVSDRPFVTLKLATSIDGAIADASRKTGWMTSPSARREVHRIRAGHDAIAVGSGTVLADDPQLTVRYGRRPRVPPTRVVFDRRGRVGVASQLIRTAKRVPTLLVTTDPPPPSTNFLVDKGVQRLAVSSLAQAMRRLREHGVFSLLCEGGAELAAAFLDAGVVDRLVIFRAPVMLGAGSLPAFGGPSSAASHLVHQAPRWRLLDARALEDDVMVTYSPVV